MVAATLCFHEEKGYSFRCPGNKITWGKLSREVSTLVLELPMEAERGHRRAFALEKEYFHTPQGSLALARALSLSFLFLFLFLSLCRVAISRYS